MARWKKIQRFGKNEMWKTQYIKNNRTLTKTIQIVDNKNTPLNAYTVFVYDSPSPNKGLERNFKTKQEALKYALLHIKKKL
jgi:hypothetical protein